MNVLKLVTKDTIEEKIIHLQGKKAKLAEDIIEGKETAEHYLIPVSYTHLTLPTIA